jgi:membrane protein DedA with SNARE-associated domain
MSDYIAKTIPQIMESMGYFGIGLLMFLENLFPPIPSELIMPLAGFAVAQGKLSFLPTVLAGVVGTVLGAFPWYYAGRVIGEPRLRRLADRYGRWLTITGKDIDKANGWFSRHEGTAVFLCRLVPGVRTLISLPAGISAMPLLPFVLYSTAGTTLWVGFLTWLGYALGSNYSLVENYIDPVSKLILVGLLLCFAVWVFRRKKNRRMHR